MINPVDGVLPNGREDYFPDQGANNVMGDLPEDRLDPKDEEMLHEIIDLVESMRDTFSISDLIWLVIKLSNFWFTIGTQRDPIWRLMCWNWMMITDMYGIFIGLPRFIFTKIFETPQIAEAWLTAGIRVLSTPFGVFSWFGIPERIIHPALDFLERVYENAVPLPEGQRPKTADERKGEEMGIIARGIDIHVNLLQRLWLRGKELYFNANQKLFQFVGYGSVSD